MLIGKKTLFSSLLGIDLLANVLELTHVNVLYTTTLIALCTCILLPGFLISLILRIGRLSLWENLLLIVGLSIAFLEFGGLLLNILLPVLGIKNPLAFQNLVIGFDGYFLLLLVFAWMRTDQFVVKVELPRHTNGEKILYVLPVFFPVLATLGAIILNNGGSNILTLILLGVIASYSLLLVLFHDKIAVGLYPHALFFIALASLFTTSLRSWYITGHDIETEFYVFQLTNTHHIWNMAIFQNAYNACLSITILPTILTHLLAIQDIYVYKVIFQILFATAPILVFFIMRNYTTPILAFLCAFFFMSFPAFFSDMPMLNRQEIGFIFFGLVLYMMLKRNQTWQFNIKFGAPSPPELSISMRKILFAIFALGTTVSHYSTNFVLLALVVFVYLSTLFISLPLVKNIFTSPLSKFHTPRKNTFTNKVFLSLPLLLLLASGTYIWNNVYTNSSNHTGSVVFEIFNSILTQSHTRSTDISYSIFSFQKPDPQKQIQNYIQSVTNATHQGNVNSSPFYSKAITSTYPSYAIPQEQLAPTRLGNLLSSFFAPVFAIQAGLRSLSAAFMQIFVFIGLLAIFFLKNKKPLDLQYLLLCFGAILLLMLEIILPSLSIEYGLLRMFQQFLFVLSLPIVLGLSSILFFVKEQRRILFVGVIAIIFFLNLTGFIAHLTGDYYPQMALDNAGLYYDAYYVHKTDVLTIVWLAKNNVNNDPVDADASGTNKLKTLGNISAANAIFPAIIRKDAYVYQKVSNHEVVDIDENLMVCNSSKPFLDRNKNLVYSNGQNNIYR